MVPSNALRAAGHADERRHALEGFPAARVVRLRGVVRGGGGGGGGRDAAGNAPHRGAVVLAPARGVIHRREERAVRRARRDVRDLGVMRPRLDAPQRVDVAVVRHEVHLVVSPEFPRADDEERSLRVRDRRERAACLPRGGVARHRGRRAARAIDCVDCCSARLSFFRANSRGRIAQLLTRALAWRPPG